MAAVRPSHVQAAAEAPPSMRASTACCRPPRQACSSAVQPSASAASTSARASRRKRMLSGAPGLHDMAASIRGLRPLAVLHRTSAPAATRSTVCLKSPERTACRKAEASSRSAPLDLPAVNAALWLRGPRAPSRWTTARLYRGCAGPTQRRPWVLAAAPAPPHLSRAWDPACSEHTALCRIQGASSLLGLPHVLIATSHLPAQLLCWPMA
mmetsp:Transcript_86134/g.257038  ORF Transcript_86134/g.257038 Transcript_86134/m.257038 type:complete len:210 (+) Transcript_86134:618-1247(+)